MPRGPLPDPNHRHRNVSVIPTTSLPAEGFGGPYPDSPYELDAGGAQWWAWAWRLPQAAGWSAGDLYVVARRARLEDEPQTNPNLREIRELDDRLGLTPKGMAALRWKIAPAETGDEAGDPEVASLADRRAKLTA